MEQSAFLHCEISVTSNLLPNLIAIFFFLQITGKSKDPQTMQRLLILSFLKIKNEIESLFLTHVITKSRLCIKKNQQNENLI